MSPNPLTRESEARREGKWYRVYAAPIISIILFCILVGFLGFLSYRSIHPRPTKPIPSNWTLYNANKSIRARGSVPGGVYSDLLNDGVLSEGDLYYRFNDLTYRWVAKDNWTYVTSFTVDKEIVKNQRVALIFDGLDTVAEVVVNGEVVGQSNNMFIRYVFDVKSQLQASADVNLEVRFESPVNYSARKYEEQSKDYIVPPKCVPNAYQGECHANHIRKMQAAFSWDWGPAFPNMGIWKPWRLVAFDSLLVNDIMFTAVPSTELPTVPDPSFVPAWNVSVQVIFDAADETGNIVGDLSINLAGLNFTRNNFDVSVNNYQGSATVEFVIEKDTVEMWWPNGYGSQPLYNLTASWHYRTANETSSKTVRVGFRTVELNQDFIDPNDETKGRHYRVHVNNVPMFMKGSNWIPAHILPEMVSDQYTRKLLQSAADVHQNCIRVWGGGIYETDIFYEIADELGILIWEDFMFACSMYPVDQDFLYNTVEEIKTQIGRLQHHPSILLWAANNENEAALRGNWYGTASNFSLYKQDYIKLYVDTLRSTTWDLDPSRPFVVSSPNNGIQSEIEGHIALNPYSNLYGDVHYYNYLSDAWNWKIYPRTRFASEYGFQSWPSFRSMKDVTTEEDWSSTSSLSYHRQHHPGGQEELSLQIGLHMHLPPQDLTQQSYQSYLYLTQVHQAVAIKTETEFYRRCMSSINEKGEGYISGALYWQLNDIWQGPSWASMELGGRWKMLHYYAKKFFSPLLVSPYMDVDNLIVSIINDYFEDFNDLKLLIDLYRYDTVEKKASFQKPVTVNASEANIVVQYNLWNDLDLDANCQAGLYDPIDVCFVMVRLIKTSDGSEVSPSNFVLLGKPKDANLPKSALKVESISGPFAKQNNDWTFNVTVSSRGVSLFVWLEVDESGVFSDNGFIMVEEKVVIEFYADQEISANALQDSISIMSLTDTYTRETVEKVLSKAMVDRALHPNDIRNMIYV